MKVVPLAVSLLLVLTLSGCSTLSRADADEDTYQGTQSRADQAGGAKVEATFYNSNPDAGQPPRKQLTPDGQVK
ncbi:MAG: hypothetical protein AAFY98_07115 [Verrucomicrobiota bacterium]